MNASQTEVPLTTFVTSYLVLQVEKLVANIHLCYIKPMFPHVPNTDAAASMDAMIVV